MKRGHQLGPSSTCLTQEDRLSSGPAPFLQELKPIASFLSLLSLPYLELLVQVEDYPALHSVPPYLAVLGPGGGRAMLQTTLHYTDKVHVPGGHIPHQPHQG